MAEPDRAQPKPACGCRSVIRSVKRNCHLNGETVLNHIISVKKSSIDIMLDENSNYLQ